jgi:hypothetical protein
MRMWQESAHGPLEVAAKPAELLVSMALGPSGALLLPALVAVLLIWLAIRLARAIIHLIVVVLVVGLLVWGYTQYRQAAALQSVAQQVATQISRGTGGTLSGASSVLAQVQHALVQAGLDPSAIRVTIDCVGGKAVLVLTDTRVGAAVGLLRDTAVRVPLSQAIHCSSGS